MWQQQGGIYFVMGCCIPDHTPPMILGRSMRCRLHKKKTDTYSQGANMHAMLLLLTHTAYQAIIANDPGAEGGDAACM
jgi:hypothetical protein